ncbi:uncharacterized protein LOC111696798 [Eurytemora carolleeae]|uniref:uncharacterized protein LOC111696798 n=1 Tax=Eurytemora carolleeae TaxID=1294199 RepID=UPI000C77BB4A|nr:uncharacterized protein LOC111696798 [Eurytemora carolleeae]|eukprot:XP_023322301.1 uncharacterized protein LOC111696798 [Eurytemora affinis]
MSCLKWYLKTPVLVCLYLSIYSTVDSVGMKDGRLYTKQTRTSKSVRSGGGHFWDNILFNSEAVKGRKETSKAQVLLSKCPDPLRCTARNFCNNDMVMSSQAENNLNFQTDQRGFISCVSSSAQLLGVCCQLQDKVGKLRSDISVDLLNPGQRPRNPFVVINVSQESFVPPNRNINSGELSRIQGTLETRVKAAMAMNALRSILGNSGKHEDDYYCVAKLTAEDSQYYNTISAPNCQYF